MARTIEKLFRAPYSVPNGLQATDEGLFLVDQITDRVALVEVTGTSDYGVTKLIRDVQSESSNTSGMAYGGGALWLAANGPGSQWRWQRPLRSLPGLQTPSRSCRSHGSCRGMPGNRRAGRTRGGSP